MTSGDGWSVAVREDADDALHDACGLAVASAARAGRLRTDELSAEVEAAAGTSGAEHSELEFDDDDEWEPLREEIAAYDPGSVEASADEPMALIVIDGAVRRQVAPYDYDWRWGALSTTVSDRVGGLIEVAGNSTHRNPSNGAAGVGVVLRSGRAATIRVLPSVAYEWSYFVMANSMLSNATVTGGLDLSAWSAGTLVSEVRRTRLLRRRVSVGEIRTDTRRGAVWGGDYQIDFPVVPGRKYEISVGAWLECTHHGGVAIPSLATASARIRGRVERVEFHRFLPS